MSNITIKDNSKQFDDVLLTEIISCDKEIEANNLYMKIHPVVILNTNGEEEKRNAVSISDGDLALFELREEVWIVDHEILIK